MFRIHALPAGNGDALLLEYGTDSNKHHVLVDGGRSTTSKALIRHLRKYAPSLDLVVVTHVDLDHIGGILNLLAPNSLVRVKEIWFNGFVHLERRQKDHLGERDLLGPVEGEQLSERIVRAGISWNKRLAGRSVVVDDGGVSPRTVEVEGLRLTILSPSWDALEDLKGVWEELVTKEGLVPGAAGPRLDGEDGLPDLLGDEDDLQVLADRPPPKNITKANRSSIALMAEFEERRCLLAGDAAPNVLISSLGLLPDNMRDIHFFKLPHHGSHSNVTKELLEQVRCKRYLFTTDGTGYRNPHPHKEAVARTIVYGGKEPILLFNYACDTTKSWARQPDDNAFPYTVKYGNDGLLPEQV